MPKRHRESDDEDVNEILKRFKETNFLTKRPRENHQENTQNKKIRIHGKFSYTLEEHKQVIRRLIKLVHDLNEKCNLLTLQNEALKNEPETTPYFIREQSVR